MVDLNSCYAKIFGSLEKKKKREKNKKGAMEQMFDSNADPAQCSAAFTLISSIFCDISSESLPLIGFFQDKCQITAASEQKVRSLPAMFVVLQTGRHVRCAADWSVADDTI